MPVRQLENRKYSSKKDTDKLTSLEELQICLNFVCEECRAVMSVVVRQGLAMCRAYGMCKVLFTK